MLRKQLARLLLALLLPAIVFGANTGKIRGKVVDKSTGEALPGATVSVVGTTLGAAADKDGSYLVINVPVGTYTLKASFVGYQTITLTNVRVNVDLTSEANFELPGEGVQVATTEIVAQRPLINKSAVNTTRIIDGDFFEKLPARGIAAAVSLQAGVVTMGGNVYVRGSRADEVGYQIEGVNAGDVVFGGRAVSITAEAMEQVQVLTGGYGAEFGGANAGLVRSQLRTGGEKWKFTMLGETDKYTSQYTKSLGGYSYGYQDLTLTAGGPLLMKELRFFGTIQGTGWLDPNVRVWEGANFPKVVTFPTKTAAHPNTARSDTISLVTPEGNIAGGSQGRYTFTGSLAYAMKSTQVRVGGSYSTFSGHDNAGFGNMLNQKRLGITDENNGFFNAKVTQFITNTTYLEASFNYAWTNQKYYDPYFKDDLKLYGDSAANAKLGFYMAKDGTPFDAYSVYLNGVSAAQLGTFNQPGTLISGYEKRNQANIGGRLDFTSQLSKTVEVKMGGEYTQYKYRRFIPGNVLNWAKYFKDYPVATRRDSLELMLRADGSNNIGYDLLGNEIEGDQYLKGGDLDNIGPRKPVYAAGYVQTKIELTDIVLNAGLRYDFIDADAFELVNPNNVPPSDTLSTLRAGKNFRKMSSASFATPRLGFSFPISDRTVFHAHFGRYIQQPRLAESYRGIALLSTVLKGGLFYQNPAGLGLRPEQTTQYEIGFGQQVSDNASFDVTAFYKDIVDQVRYIYIIAASGAQNQSYPIFTNGDFSTTRGFEFKFTLRRTERVTASINYTLSDARGTGSTSQSAAGIWGAAGGQGAFVPKFIFPTTFNQVHRGNIFLDYRFAKNDGGPILEQLGLNVLLTFHSGANFTRIQATGQATTDPRTREPIEEVGESTMPWFFQLDARLDKTFQLGPVDVNAYIYVINLLGTDNVENVYIRTGDPLDDGWLSTTDGKMVLENFGAEKETFRQMYNTFNGGRNSNNFGPPRQIRFGLKLEF